MTGATQPRTINYGFEVALVPTHLLVDVTANLAQGDELQEGSRLHKGDTANLLHASPVAT